MSPNVFGFSSINFRRLYALPTPNPNTLSNDGCMTGVLPDLGLYVLTPLFRMTPFMLKPFFRITIHAVAAPTRHDL